MGDLHSVLARQLRRVGASEHEPPSAEQWGELLARIDQAYRATDEDRYTMERSLEISSTEMREHQRQIGLEHDRMLAVVRSLSVGLVQVDQNFRVAMMNPAAEELLGVDIAQATGIPLSHFLSLSAAGRSATAYAWDRLMPLVNNGSSVQEHDGMVTPARAEHFHASFSVSPIITGDACIGAVVLFRNVNEYKALQERVLEATRLAGMAEVASGVLHNVGNALNSITVSNRQVSLGLQGGKLDSLTKLSELITSRASDLSTFLSTDPRGRRIPEFLERLTDALRAERRALLEENQRVRSGLEHVTAIVSSQQSVARSGGVFRVVRPVDVLKEAILLEGTSLGRHGVQLVEDFADIGDCVLDSSRVAQIVTNLVKNAKDSVVAFGAQPMLVIVRLRLDGERLYIEVEDNGVGMTKEHLRRVYEHGFTTKKTGHGFGLHMCALSAQEMGATLVCRSNGPGTGATFTLTLPYRPVRSEEVPDELAEAG